VGSSRLDELTARARATIAASLGPSAAPGSGADSIASPASAPEVSHLVVLGIDPGLATTGYGVVAGSTRADGSYAAIEFGTIETAAGTGTPSRLAEIHARAGLLLRRHCPAVVAIERLFFGANATTAMAVGQARGVLILAAAQAGVPVVEYTPLEVKSALAGFGRAPKAQMQRMVQALLALESLPRPDDAADGLALALAHLRLAATRHARIAAGG
jgi:crossover junction endodeoxyribonuclease RuvC